MLFQVICDTYKSYGVSLICFGNKVPGTANTIRICRLYHNEKNARFPLGGL